MNQKLNRKNGFTLIELIAVVVILGVLAAAAVPRFIDMGDKARNAAANGLVAGWLSECSTRTAQAALDSTFTFACPAIGDSATDSNRWDGLEAGDFTVALGGDGTTASPCTISVTKNGLTEAVQGSYVNQTYTAPTEE